MNYIIYDVIIAAVLLFFLWLGYRKGFVLTLCSLLAVFVALIGACVLSNALAEPAAKVIEPIVANSIHDTVTSYYQRAPETGATSQDEADWLAQLPLDELLEPLKQSKAFEGLTHAFQAAVDAGVAEIAAGAAQSLAHFVAVQIARIVIFAVAFLAVLIAWSVLSHALDLVAKLPVLSTVNAWGGGAVGLLKGALVLFIAGWLLRDSLPPDTVEKTYLLKFFCTVSPLSFFL